MAEGGTRWRELRGGEQGPAWILVGALPPCERALLREVTAAWLPMPSGSTAICLPLAHSMVAVPPLSHQDILLRQHLALQWPRGRLWVEKQTFPLRKATLSTAHGAMGVAPRQPLSIVVLLLPGTARDLTAVAVAWAHTVPPL